MTARSLYTQKCTLETSQTHVYNPRENICVLYQPDRPTPGSVKYTFYIIHFQERTAKSVQVGNLRDMTDTGVQSKCEVWTYNKYNVPPYGGYFKFASFFFLNSLGEIQCSWYLILLVAIKLAEQKYCIDSDMRLLQFLKN